MADLACRGRLIIVAFDPGGTTGFARLSLSKRLLRKEGARGALAEMTREDRWRSEQFGQNPEQGLKCSEEENSARMAMLTRLGWVEEVREPDYDTFVSVVEDFVLLRQERSRNLLSPVRLTASYRTHLASSGVRITLQSPGDAKRTVTDARLRSWLHDEGGKPIGRHAKDALRHAILFARKWSSSAAVREWAGTGLLPTQPTPSAEDGS